MLAVAVMIVGTGAPASAKEVLLRIGDVHVPAGTLVRGDAVAVGGSAYVEGTVEGDAIALGGSVEVAGHVGGFVRALGGNVMLRSTAVVDGGVSAAGGTVTQEPGASVRGQPAPPAPFPLPLPAPGPGEPQPAPPWWIPGLAAGLWWLLHTLFWAGQLLLLAVLVGAAWVTATLFPHAVARVGAVLERDAAIALAAGAAAWPVILVTTALFAISIVGLPLALSMPAVVFVAALFGLTALARIVGRRVHPSDAIRETVIGALLLAIAFSLPLVGHLAALAAVTWGLGAVLVALAEAGRFRSRPPDAHPPASPQTPGPTAAA